MITLYIKTHRVTGLKYFGKTTADDPIKYSGSGTYWLRHLMKHGNDYDTEIYLQSENQEYITQEALRFSRAYDIVNSELWANLAEETGLDGRVKGLLHSEETKEKISQAQKGKIHSKETRDKMSESGKGRIAWNKGKIHSEETRNKMSDAHRNKFVSEKTREKLSKAKEKVYLIINPNGEEQIISNLTNFCKENNLSQPKMSSVVSGKISHHKRYIAKRMENS